MARLIDVTPEELETVLDRIQREQITKLEIFGPRVWCGDNPNNLPVHSECEVVYHLHLEMDGLAKSIAKCRSLTHCWLLGHNFDETDVRLIAEGLTNLTWLNVVDCNIGDSGARSFAEGLPNLTSLDLIDNPVTDLSPFALRIKAGWPVLEDFSDDEGLHVENCPLQTPPLEIVQQGPEAVRNYFIARDSSSAS